MGRCISTAQGWGVGDTLTKLEQLFEVHVALTTPVKAWEILRD